MTIHLTLNEVLELKSCIGDLEIVLQKLDRIGAGIAAIHVDAALVQLRNNLDSAEDAGTQFLSEFCGSQNHY